MTAMTITNQFLKNFRRVLFLLLLLVNMVIVPASAQQNQECKIHDPQLPRIFNTTHTFSIPTSETREVTPDMEAWKVIQNWELIFFYVPLRTVAPGENVNLCIGKLTRTIVAMLGFKNRKITSISEPWGGWDYEVGMSDEIHPNYDTRYQRSDWDTVYTVLIEASHQVVDVQPTITICWLKKPGSDTQFIGTKPTNKSNADVIKENSRHSYNEVFRLSKKNEEDEAIVLRRIYVQYRRSGRLGEHMRRR